MPLGDYQKKRDFKKTPEPHGRRARRPAKQRSLQFVIQEHHARRIHWDIRLEHHGVLKSWALTRRPTLKASERVLAIETEDHPLDYGSFEGTIPRGQYGAGTVEIWDQGNYQAEKPFEEAFENGVISVSISGKRLHGRFVLVRIFGDGPRSRWLFFRAQPKIKGLKVPKTISQTQKR